MKKLFLLPSAGQFASWSLLSKATYISFWMGAVGLLITILTTYPMIEKHFQPTEETIRIRLDAMLKKKQLADADDLLSKIAGRDDLKDAYNFYKGTFAMESGPIAPVEPRVFFRKINPDSDLFEKAVRNERVYYSRLYRANNEPLYYRKVEAMLDEVAVMGWLTPRYYALRVAVDSNKDGAFQKISHWYTEFDHLYSKYLDKATYDGVAFSTSGGPDSNFRLKPNIESLALVPEVYFYIALHLAGKSGELCDNRSEKRVALNIMQEAIEARKRNNRPSMLDSIDKRLDTRYQQKEIDSLLQWLNSLAQCEPNTALQGTLRQKAA